KTIENLTTMTTATKRYRTIAVSIDAETAKIVDELSKAWGTNRSDTIRRIILLFYADYKST
ncbi:MAG: ribbon-helix-helix protein, CopG family, partial [Thermosphaera sp.]